MADSLYTSERLCKVITQNFREDVELKQRLKSLEIKRRQALVRIILKTLEIERDIGSLLLPGVAKTAVHAYRKYNNKPVQSRSSCHSGTSSVDRRLVNEQSYQELIENRCDKIKDKLQYDMDFLNTKTASVYRQNSLKLPEIHKRRERLGLLEKKPTRASSIASTRTSDASRLGAVRTSRERR